MDINSIREISKTLQREISSLKKIDKTPLSVGASGDRTYLIDRIAENTIITHLEKLKEPITIVSEEIGIKEILGGGKKILIDPIDGSRNAIQGIPFFCTSISVLEGNTINDINIGYIINLINGDEFWAEKGKGAFFNGEKIKTQQDDIFYLIAFEAQSPKNDIHKITPLVSNARKVRCFGSIALDLAYLASGSISIFISPSPSRGIDFSAGIIIVKEAGGIVTDLNGKDIGNIKIGIHRSTTLLVSGNEKLHKKALKLLETQEVL